jgi:hypothetical protein
MVFSMKRWYWAILILELSLFAMILILPQVALPSFTFHSGTAPVVMKTRVSTSPGQQFALLLMLWLALLMLARRGETKGETAIPGLKPQLSELCTLIC